MNKKHPDAMTISGFITALRIFSKYTRHGLNTKYCFSTSHDIIYFTGTSIRLLPESSKDGQTLISLGWHVEESLLEWAYFT